MPFGTDQAWGIILPVARSNLIQNPSFERGTTGWVTVSALGGAVDFGTFANPTEISGNYTAVQTFGAWGGDSVADQPEWSGVAGGTWTSTNGSAYNASLYVNLPSGSAGKILVGTANAALSGASVIGSVDFVGGGTFHRYVVAYTETSTQTRRLIALGTNIATQHMLFDGAQAEQGSITTYIDGDQPGCYWTGLPHLSASVRSGTSRAGGTVIALSDLGLFVSESPGAGMPPLENTSQSFALLDGAEFQRQRAGIRSFSLNAYIVGTSRSNLHSQRQTIIDALKIDLVSPQQPTVFWYVGGPGTVQTSAVLDAGLGFNQKISEDGFSELPSVQFLGHDPFWYSTTDQGASLPPRTALGSVNHIAWRDPLGQWGTMGVNGTTVQLTGASPLGIFTILPLTGGTVLIGGNWGTVGGTVSPAIGRWNQATNRFGTFGGTVLRQDAPTTIVYKLIQTPSGTVFLGGDFGTVAGTQGAWRVAQWTGAAFGTLIGGTINGGEVRTLLFQGSLIVGGDFTSAGGSATRFIARHVNNAWGTLTGGTVDARVSGLARGLDGRIFAAGNFTVAAGTSANGVAFWNGAWGSMGTLGPPATSAAVAIAPSGIAYVGGQFLSLNGGSAGNLASYNGVQLFAAGSGVRAAANPRVSGLLVDPQTNDLYIAGAFTDAGGIPIADGLAVYNGYAYHGLDIALTPPGTFRDVQKSQDGTLYAAGTFSSVGYCASVTQVVNAGRRETYPVWKARNAGAGTARIYQLLNTLTGDEIYFNYSLQPGEDITLDFTPGNQSFNSSFAGNIYGKILAGGDLATWRLMPGTNWVSFFSDSDSLISSLYWRPRHWSFDSGTNL